MLRASRAPDLRCPSTRPACHRRALLCCVSEVVPSSLHYAVTKVSQPHGY